MSGRRVAYVNGAFVPEEEAAISIHDLGFVYGDAVYDTARTFSGKLFKLPEHIARLYRTLRYVRIDPGLAPQEMTALTEELVARNLPLLREGEDYWVTQRISRGLLAYDAEPAARQGATVVIECVPLPLRARARYFRDGIAVATPAIRRTPPEALSPRAKTTNYLNMILGGLEIQGRDPEAWAVLLDRNGNLCEGIGANIFLVRDGELMTPREDYILPGVSRATVIELAEQLGIPCSERDLSPHDAAIADEAFLTSTSLCLCPVVSIDGQDLAAGRIPGPVTARLMQAFSEAAGIDYVAQYLRFLPA
ncbi:MAG: aminotransferase class IV [Rhodovibrionaceae bacterium]